MVVTGTAVYNWFSVRCQKPDKARRGDVWGYLRTANIMQLVEFMFLLVRMHQFVTFLLLIHASGLGYQTQKRSLSRFSRFPPWFNPDSLNRSSILYTTTPKNKVYACNIFQWQNETNTDNISKLHIWLDGIYWTMHFTVKAKWPGKWHICTTHLSIYYVCLLYKNKLTLNKAAQCMKNSSKKQTPYVY